MAQPILVNSTLKRMFHLAAIPVAALLGSLLVLRFADELDWQVMVLTAIPGVLVLAGWAWRQAALLARLTSQTERLHATLGLPLPVPSDSLGEQLEQALGALQQSLLLERRRQSAEASAADAILDILPDPILWLDSGRRILRSNMAATGLLGENLAGRDLTLVLRHPTILDMVDAVLADRMTHGAAEFSLPVPTARDFEARTVQLPRSADGRPTAILILHDLTSAKRAEQMRADFVANASHELRTPLATLIGFIETLQGPARDDAAAREKFLGIMQDQAGRMARLIRDLLSLSQIEMNEHKAPSGRVDLNDVLRSVVDMLQLQAAQKGMLIKVQAVPDLPPTIGDQDELIQVFQNLIDNAVKYGPPNSAVEIAITRPGSGALTVAVRDHGEGIAREHLPRLTERFYRVDSARSRALGGTGLGLAIVKHILNRHRGSLLIDSVLGQGSTFTVTLPAAEPAASEPNRAA